MRRSSKEVISQIPTTAPKAIEIKELPASTAEALQHSEARANKRVGKKVTETAIALLDQALAPAKERKALLAEKVKKGQLDIAATHEAFQIFEKAVGGRAALLETLRQLPEQSVGAKMLHNLIEDPDFINIARNNKDEEVVRYSLGVLCRRHRLPFNSLVAAFRDSKTAQIALESLMQLAPHTPEVVEQVAEDAKNRYVPCSVCEGRTRVPRIGEDGEFLVDEQDEVLTQLCYECRGTGKLWQKHDTHNRKLFLQMIKLVESDKQKGDVNVTLQQASFGGQFVPGDGSFERIVKGVNLNCAPTQAVESEVIIDVPNTVYESEASNPGGSAPTGAG